ncbi:DeoR/GlpR family DNA-binding transcription regulator [Azospirillum halopraeferens]|uniref:DeoR/GlpR family DNA-binding transcription regulator n=1 Tax=Azospirillum halopraeferens TaxID=34010 RepID=UPI00041B6B7C|nr:DeoR/GlpR family DNA-binding transcription regulator [Azospirillum halopraeferens]
MRKAERYEQVVEVVRRKGFATVEDLSLRLGVTAQTIRRDIRALSAAGTLRKYHGGAGLPALSEGVAYKTRKIRNVEAKRRIGAAVCALIPDGASLFIDTGTTCEAVAEALTVRKGLRVVTNNLHVAQHLAERTDFELAVAGGFIRNADGGVMGDPAAAFLAQFRFDAAVIGISGIDTDGTLMEYDHREVLVTRAALRRARTAIVACDAGKFGRPALVCLGPVTDVDTLVCDAPPEGPLAAAIHAAGVRVVVA